MAEKLTYEELEKKVKKLDCLYRHFRSRREAGHFPE